MKTAVRSAPAALPVPLRRPLTVVALLAAIVVVVLGVLHFHDSGLTGLDAAVLPSLDGVQPPWRYLALVFDFFNGFHDAANSVATVVTHCSGTNSKLLLGLRAKQTERSANRN